MTTQDAAPASTKPDQDDCARARCWVFLILAILFALCIWPTLWSYHGGLDADHLLVRRNRISGEVQVLTPATSWPGDQRPATWQPLVIKPGK